MSGNPLMGMMQGNNPIFQMVNMLKNGGNPMAMLNQMAGQNPQMKQVIDSVNGKNPAQMGEMINQLAQQRGINMNDLVANLGVPEDVVKNLGIK